MDGFTRVEMDWVKSALDIWPGTPSTKIKVRIGRGDFDQFEHWALSVNKN